MSKKDIWETDLLKARDKWDKTKDPGDYEIYAIACAAYLCSKEFEESRVHWFCGDAKIREFAVSSLIMFSFTPPEDTTDPAHGRYKAYESKFTRMLTSCEKCAVAYQRSDGDLMNELIEKAGIQETRVLTFFREIHRKDRDRLAKQLAANKNCGPVLAEVLWSYACMTVSSFVNDNIIGPKLLTGGSQAMRNISACPGFVMLSFMHVYDVRQAAMHKILKPENVPKYIAAWKNDPSKFNKMFSHGLKRNIQAAHWADLAWYTASLFLSAFCSEKELLKSLIDICAKEMKTARGIPKFGAHYLVCQIMKYLHREPDMQQWVTESVLEPMLDYVTQSRGLVAGAVDNDAPEAARTSESYRHLDAMPAVDWVKKYVTREPAPPAARVVKRVQFLLDLKPEAFNNAARDYDHIAPFAVKVGSMFADTNMLELLLNTHAARLAKHFTEYKAQWIAPLWKQQVASAENLRPFWAELLKLPSFSFKSVQGETSPGGVVVGILQASKDVALIYKLPTKSQKTKDSSSATVNSVGSSDGVESSQLETFIKELVESLTDTGEVEGLSKILLDKHVLKSMLLLSISGNRGLSLAAEEFMKQAVDADSREALVQHLVKYQTELTLTAVNSILADAAPASTTWLAAMPGLIRLALTILDQIYSIHDGVELAGNRLVLKLLRCFWEKSWAIVANVIKSIRTWAQDYAVSHVKSVLIAVLEFSQGLLSKFRLLDADLSASLTEEHNWGGVLADPAISCINSMGDMLQLAIPELLAMAVSIIIEILGLMASFDVAIPPSISSLLEGLATKRLNSRLSKDQLRELLSATNMAEEEITDLIENPRPRRTPGSNLSSGASSQTSSQSLHAQHQLQSGGNGSFHPKSTSSQQQQQQQLSIGDFFKTSGGQRPPIQPRTVVNNQVTPQTPHQLSGINLIRAQLSGTKMNGDSLNKLGHAVPQPSSIGVIHPERPPGFNPRKPVTAGLGAAHGNDSSADSDDDDDDDDDGDGTSALKLLGAQRKREEAASKLREAYEQTKSRSKAQMLVDNSPGAQLRQQQQQRDREARAMKARLSAQPTELHREMLRWDYFAELPPFKAKSSISDRFGSVEQYQEVMTPLLYLEAWEQVQNAKQEALKNQPEVFQLVFGKRVKVDGFTDVYVSASKEMFAKAQLGESDMLLLGYDRSNPSKLTMPAANNPHCFARIKEGTIKNFGHSSKTQYIDFQVRMSEQTAFLAQLNSGSSVCGINLGSVRTVEREFTSLIALPHYDLLDSVLAAKPAIADDHPEHIHRLQTNLGLNKSQAIAVSRSLSSQGFNLVQGPPGTGKTKTILGIIGVFFTASAMVAQATGQPKSDNKKILVCANSNAAVDEIVLRLKRGVTDLNGNHQNLNILRMGRLEMIAEEVRDVTLDEMVAKSVNNSAEPVDEQLRKDHTALTNERNTLREKLQNQQEHLSAEEVAKLTNRLKDLGREIREKNYALDMQRDRLEQARKQKDLHFRQQQNDVLQKAQVVCTTLSASAHPLLASLGVTFDTVIIDEAAQCIELSALIPLKYGCKHCIMVGDPNQLPPTVISQEASRLKYEQSLFVRMFNQYKDVEGAVSMLDTQFRMHPEIAAFPSAEFYDGKLKNADGLAEQLVRPWHKAHRALGPYSFFEVQGKHERGGKSLRNTAEAQAAVQLVQYVRNKFSEVGSIGVISPYREQVRLLRQEFIKTFGAEITSIVSFNSIDGFQGQEKDIIIMSCVRANDAKVNHVGFLGDIRRMNVAITRAKASLWVLGHSGSLVVNPVWKALIEDAQARGKFIPQLGGGNIVNSVRKFEDLPPSRLHQRASQRENSRQPSPALSDESDSAWHRNVKRKQASYDDVEQTFAPKRQVLNSEDIAANSSSNSPVSRSPSVAAPVRIDYRKVSSETPPATGSPRVSPPSMPEPTHVPNVAPPHAPNGAEAEVGPRRMDTRARVHPPRKKPSANLFIQPRRRPPFKK